MKYKNLDINIEDVQKVELEILLEFDRICSKNNIKYQLFAGTLLGAIRHKGFIPWDDDIDVCMLRTDFERLIECCKHDLSNNYFFQYYETDENCYYHYGKIRKNNTIFANNIDVNTNMHKGIYIDIFPLDNILPSSFLGKFHRIIIKILYTLSSSRIKNKAIYSKSKFNKIGRLLMYYVIKIVPHKPLDRLITKVMCMFNSVDSKYITHLSTGAPKSNINKYMMEKDKFYDTIEGEFEGYKFPIPRNYHDVLKRLFGNYMIPPPVDEQYPHHDIVNISFDTMNDK